MAISGCFRIWRFLFIELCLIFSQTVKLATNQIWQKFTLDGSKFSEKLISIFRFVWYGFSMEKNCSLLKIQSNLSNRPPPNNDHLPTTTNILGSHFLFFYNVKLPLSNDRLSTTATKSWSKGRSLYKGLTVCISLSIHTSFLITSSLGK